MDPSLVSRAQQGTKRHSRSWLSVEPRPPSRRSRVVRVPGLMAAGLLVLVAACAAPSPAPELVLGQTFGLYYDPERERVVLVNGAPESGPARPTELWAWDGSSWTLLDDDGPEARNYGAVGYDPERGVLVMHGGQSSSGVSFDETVEWNGETWSTAASGDGPGPREGPGFTWDPGSDRMLLFGGAENGTLHGDTWTWSGTAWEQIAVSGPRPRFVNLMAEYRNPPLAPGEPSGGYVLLQGGHWVEGDDGGNLEDTWQWDGEIWTELDGAGPGPRVNSPGAFDERLDGIVMFGGGNGETEGTGTNDTWLWAGIGGWTQLATPTAPSRRNAHGLAFDSKRQVLVLVGGIERAGGEQVLDVWEYGPDGWDEVMAPS